MAYKKLIKVSNVCQLLDKSKYPATTTKEGVTFTNNGDGTITANGTTTKKSTIGTEIKNWTPIIGHKILVSGCPEGGGANTFSLGAFNQQGAIDYGNGAIGSVITTGKWFGIIFNSGVTFDNLTFKPQLFDLTEMYGAGHEPTTVEQFRQDFPEEMYDYSPYCWATSYSRRLKVNNVCQLLDKRKYPATKTINGVTFTNNGDGTITANGTSTQDTLFHIFTAPYTKNHIILLIGCPSGGSSNAYCINTSYGNDYGNGVIKKNDRDITIGSIYIRIYANITVSNLTFKPQLFDLTEIYGAGNEPTTVEQFRADFPNELYDYKPYSIVPSYQRNLTCKTKNLFDISKYAGSYSSNSTYELSNNSIKLNITGKDAYIGQQTDTKIAFKVEPNTTYYFSCDYTNTNNTLSKIIIGIFNNEKVWINNIFMFSNGLLKGSFTTNDSTYYLSFRFGSNSVENEISTSIFSNIMVVKGSTSTDYVPYGHL